MNIARIFQRSLNGLKLTFKSILILYKHKKLVFFPIISFLINLTLFIIILGLFFKINQITGFFKVIQSNNNALDKKDILKLIIPVSLILFLILFLQSTIKNIFKLSLMKSVKEVLQDGQFNLTKNILFGFSKTLTAMIWALITLVINSLLIFIKSRKKEELKEGEIILESVSSVFLKAFSLGWELSTFFVMPILTFENLDIIASIKKSYFIIKNKFMESLGGKIGFGILNFINLLISISLLIIFFWMFSSKVISAKILISAIIFVSLIAMLINTIKSTAKSIFKCIIYLHATNNFSEGRELIDLFYSLSK